MNIKDIFKIIKFKRIAHKKYVTPKGECYINYIIDKYINATKPDNYIEAYETMITKHEGSVKEVEILNKFLNSYTEETPELVHFLAANIALAMILISLHESEVQKYLNLITNPKARYTIDRMCHPDKRRIYKENE